MQQHNTLSMKEIATLFLCECTSSHNLTSILHKMYRLKANPTKRKNRSLPPKKPTPLQIYLASIEDTPSTQCASCTRLMFAKNLHLLTKNLMDIGTEEQRFL